MLEKNNADIEKIKYFITSKINQYLTNKPYSSAKIREKLLILPKKYPKHPYYPQYTSELIDEVIAGLEEIDVINNKLFIDEVYQSLEFKAWSNKKIWDYLQYKQLYSKELITELKEIYQYRDEANFLDETIRKLKIKVTRWERKHSGYKLEQKIRQELYKDKWENETIELILNKLK